MLVIHCAACTRDGDDAIEIWEKLAEVGQEGSNTCLWRWGSPVSPPRPPTQDCTALAFGRDCSRMTGRVTIRFMVADTFTLVSAKSRMEDFLQILGIGNVTEMTGNLTVENIGVNIDAPVSLNFFTKLRRINILTIIGTQNAAFEGINFIVGFPGLNNLDQLNGVNLIRTSLSDVDFFGNLRCVGIMQFFNNIQLKSLDGIQNTRVGITELRQGLDGSDMLLTGQKALVGPESLIPLSKMAGCGAQPRPAGGLFIDTTCPTIIDSWAALCGILQTQRCDTRPPLPPQSGPDSPSPPSALNLPPGLGRSLD
jgi:hypothetical protein